MIVSGPEVGKSSLLVDLAREVEGAHLLVVLSERPEEVRDARKKLPFGTELFVALEHESALRRLHNLELGMQRAMRLAEQGEEVIVLVDSITKALVDPLNSLPPPPGVGIESGAVNPLMRDLIGVVLNVAGNYTGSITVIATVLNEGDIQSQMVVSKCRRTGTGEITLSAELAAAGVFPALDFGIEEVRGRGGLVRWRLTNARRVSDWMEPTFEKAALGLQTLLGPQQCLREVLEEHAGERFDRQLLEKRARDRTIERLQRLVRLINVGAEDREIFRAFGIEYEPGTKLEPTPLPTSMPTPTPAPTPSPVLSDEEWERRAQAWVRGE